MVRRPPRSTQGRSSAASDVYKRQEGGIAAQLHRQPQQPLGRLLDQLLPHAGRAGEGELAQPGVADDRLHDLAGVSGGHDIEHALRQTALLQQLREQEHRQGRLRRGLDDHRATGRDRRPDLASAHREREVPGRDHEGRADGLLHRHEARRAVGGHGIPAVDPDRLLAEPAEELGAVDDLAAGLGEGLAHLQGHQRRDVLGVRSDRGEDRPQDLAPFPRGSGCPVRFDRCGAHPTEDPEQEALAARSDRSGDEPGYRPAGGDAEL